MRYIHTMEYYSTARKNEIIPFAGAWMDLEMIILGEVGAQYATGGEWRNNSRKNEETESKQKQYPVEDVTGDGSKV